MKSLVRFMFEALTSKTIELNFKDLEGEKDARTSLIELLDEKGMQHSETDKTVTITVTAEKTDDVKAVYDQLMGFVNTIRNSQKRSSDEQYAQKTLSFANSVKELIEFIDSTQAETPADNTEDEKSTKELEKKAPAPKDAKLKGKPGRSDQSKNEDE